MPKRDKQKAVRKLLDRIAAKERIQESPRSTTSKGVQHMTKDEVRRFEELCAKIISEKDEAKFTEAVRELNSICDMKEGRLREQSHTAG